MVILCEIWPKYCNAVIFGAESIIKKPLKPCPSQGNSNNVVLNHYLITFYIPKKMSLLFEKFWEV